MRTPDWATHSYIEAEGGTVFEPTKDEKVVIVNTEQVGVVILLKDLFEFVDFMRVKEKELGYLPTGESLQSL